VSIPKDIAASIDRGCFESFKDAYQRLKQAAISDAEAKVAEQQVQQTIRQCCPSNNILPPGYQRSREQQFRLTKAQFVRLCRQVTPQDLFSQQFPSK